jgi:hypothetical protein
MSRIERKTATGRRERNTEERGEGYNDTEKMKPSKKFRKDETKIFTSVRVAEPMYPPE